MSYSDRVGQNLTDPETAKDGSAERWVPLADENGRPLLDESGNPLLVQDTST
jgi:hypothetical protein